MIFLLFRRFCSNVCTEIGLIGKNLPLICVSALLCCTGGILLWVNAGSAVYIARNIVSRSGSITLIFLVSCASYCLHGVLMAILYLYSKNRMMNPQKAFAAFFLTAVSFIFHLMWYVIRFCTILTIFSLIPLVISALMLIANLFSTRIHQAVYCILNIVLLVITAYFGVFAVLFILPH